MITIYHWDESLCDVTGYKQNEKFESNDLYKYIIDNLLKTKLNIMICPIEDNIVIHVDGKYRFRQR